MVDPIDLKLHNLSANEPSIQEIENSKWIDLTAQDEEGNSALILAVLSNRPQIVRLILEKAIASNKFNEVNFPPFASALRTPSSVSDPHP